MVKSYVCFDLETTGLSVEEDDIIEIGAVKVVEGKVTERFMEFVNPMKEISPKIQEITGITNEMVAGARQKKDVVVDFLVFCESLPLIGHNLMFDYRFTKKAAAGIGLTFEKQGIDTLKIARKVHKNLESKSLGSLCDYYHINNSAAHRAYHDALATAKVYQCLGHYYAEAYPELFEAVPLHSKIKKVEPMTNKQKVYLNNLIKYHKIDFNGDMETMTKSQASKTIDKIILLHGKMM